MAFEDIEQHRDRLRLVRMAGVVTIVLSVLAMIGGVGLVGTLASDLSSTMSVSRSALTAIGDTIESVDDIAANTGASLDAAGASVSGVSSTVDSAVLAIDNIAGFLEGDFPEDLESVRAAMPAAIQAANAIDTTLRALSFVGVSYDPDQPFGESLAELDDALASLPDELRLQADSLRLLIPSAEALAEDTDLLATEVENLSSSLAGFTALTDQYESTLVEAEATIEATARSVDQKIWLGRLLSVLVGAVGIAIGLAVVWLSDVIGETIDDIPSEDSGLSLGELGTG